MINTTNEARVASRPANNVGQAANLQQAFSQFQALTQTSSNSFSPEQLQNLLVLIQGLINQLKGSSEDSSNTNEDGNTDSQPDLNVTTHEENTDTPQDTPEGDQLDPNESTGTSGDDTIKGTRENDTIYAGAGNDRVSGRQGDDTLLGQQGDDHLYGGSGDDLLRGGEGNDYLSGGRGNNVLFGGDGDDTLYSRLGSDTLDGGNGNDTARIRASIDDFTIEAGVFSVSDDLPEDGSVASTARSGRVITLTHKETGQVIEAKDIENFRFNDARLSLDEMVERSGDTTNPPQNNQLVPLSAQQVANLFKIFDADPSSGAGVRVVDKDGDGKVSEGDEAILANGDASSVSQQFKTLSADDVASVNGGGVIPDPEDSRLELTQRQHDAISTLFNDTAPLAYDGKATEFTGAAYDKNGDNKLGEGDVVKLRIYGGNSPLPNETVIDHVLTADEASVINGDTPTLNRLELTDSQSSAISDHYDRTPGPDVFDGLTVRFTGTAIDKDGDGKLSVGDTVKLHETGGIAGLDRIVDQTVTAADLNAINNTNANVLTLSTKQQDAIDARFNRLPSPQVQDLPETKFTGVAIDKNGDGKLGVGDVVKLLSVGGFTFPPNQNIETDHVLTADDIAFIESDRSNPLLDMSSGLSADQSSRLLNAIYDHKEPTGASVYSVFDSNSDGKISVGDFAGIGGFPVIQVGNNEPSLYIEITQDILDKYLNNGS